jgi:RHS repeat-associated protein
MKRRFNSIVVLSMIAVLTIGALPTSVLSANKGVSSALRFSNQAKALNAPAHRLNSLISRRSAEQSTAPLAGQTATLLPDGRWLLVGGQADDGPVTVASIKASSGESVTIPSATLHTARAWHTATMLPNGTVLIWGGQGEDGKIVDTAEIYDPQTQSFETITSGGLIPRLYHTATLLTEGLVLIAGGVDQRGRALNKVELWNPRTRKAEVLPDRLQRARYNHNATLLADGNVLLFGGLSKKGHELKESEVYSFATRQFSLRTDRLAAQADELLRVAASLPEAGATEVSVNTSVAIRFSKPLNVRTVNSQTVSLVSPYAAVETTVVPAESGMLAFVTPNEALLPGTAYTVSLAGATDLNNAPLPMTAVSFTTAQESLDAGTGDDEQWLPDASNQAGGWQTNRAKSTWQSLPPLQAEPGVTAIAGQALTLNGKPLAGVTLAVENQTTQTDQTGRFLLKDLPAGRHVLVIDGRTASRHKKRYGVFEAGVNIEPNQTNVLDYTIWMTMLDTAHEVDISIPTPGDFTVTTPYIPGLELHIPANTYIYDREGQAITRISITPIPVDRPPFPLPKNVYVPIYFTIQPGGATVEVVDDGDDYGSHPYGARLYYPNYRKEAPGMRANFWHYDPENKGWYVYGQGTVTADGKQVVPDPGIAIKRLTGAMINAGNYTPPPPGPPPGGGTTGGDPVDLSTGLFVMNNTDLALPDTLPIAVTRTYRQGDNVSRQFGFGATLGIDMYLWSANQYQEADLILPDGGRVHYVRTSSGTGFADALFEHTATQTAFYKSTLGWNGNGWDLRLKDGTVFVFGDVSPLQSIRDRYGNTITLTRIGNANGNISRITSPNGRYIDLTWDTSNRVTQATDNIGRSVIYTYDADGNLWKVTNPNNEVTEYTYNASHQLLTIKDARNLVYLTNEYDSNGRVFRQTQADLTTYQFAYTLDANGKVTQTDLTDPRGNVRRVMFNTDGCVLTDTYALGKPEEQTYTYVLQAATNQVQSATDALGRRTDFTYDTMGNVTSVTGLAGTAEAITSSFTYEPAFNKLATATDPLNHTLSFGHDSLGNLSSVTDPLNHQVSLTYNSAGQPLTVTDAVNKTSQFTYDAGDLIGVTNPLGHQAQMFVDPAGRVLSAVDPLGRRVKYQYDVLNRVTAVTDPLQGITQLAYDPNGNLLSVTDARNHAISYVYDNMDRVQARTDALLKSTGYLYDNNGNLRQATDRKNQVTGLTYDALNRLTQVTYADSSMTTYTYDAGNRLTQIVDSVSGTISYGYDNLSRVTSVTTPQGAVSYTYDAAGRRTSMTVPGQAVISYTYDNANRLTQIQQGAATVGFSYDAANRLTSETLPNGVVAAYGYDDASRLTSITYTKGVTTVGTLSYEYDAAGQRTRVGGSLARTGIPQVLSSASYNNANRQTGFGAQTLSYDDNGNLTSDGSNTYTWNARNQLTGISGPGLTANFSYDAVGRRTIKTVNGSTTSFLYDGANVVQEQGSGTANLLTGGLDTFFSRTDASGAVTALTDSLGSVVGLTDASGAIQTSYSYEPFGKATATGAASGNAQKYTGREDDGTGLYYYRNRYYSPTLQRFISEDPIGLLGGVNVYAYVGNNPVNYADLLGLKPTSRFGSFLAGFVDYFQPDPGAGSVMHHLTMRELMRGGGYGVDEDDYDSGQGAGRAVETGVEVYYGIRTGWEVADGLGEALARRRACFVAGTKVATPQGDKAIEQVQVGELVLAADPEGGAARPQKVTRTFERRAPEVLDIEAGGETITATPEHPFWVEGRGWTAAGDLTGGAALVNKDGKIVRVEAVRQRAGSFPVYNLEVEQAHTYFVSRLAVLVHNQCRFTPDQDALIQLAKDAKRKGVSPTDAQTLRQWAKEVGLPSRGPEAHPGRPYGQFPHIHIGPVDHIPVRWP